jgi:hypothetical protein
MNYSSESKVSQYSKQKISLLNKLIYPSYKLKFAKVS